MENELKRKHQEKWLRSISWILFGVIIVVFLVPVLNPKRFCFDFLEYAAFVGGLAGPLASLVGFIYVYLTFLGQQRQLNEQRERLDREEASKEFAEYLNLWNEFRGEVIYKWNNKSGTKAFDSYWLNVRKSVWDDSKSQVFNILDPKAFKGSLQRHLTTSSFNKETGQYEVFLRMIYPLLEIAERGKLIGRLNYLENLLSDGEKAILVYSATFLDKKHYAIKLFKSGFCQNLDDKHLISPKHRDLIF
jgi:hypothetical protein